MDRTRLLRLLRRCMYAAALLIVPAAAALADVAGTNPGAAATLSARYIALRKELTQNQFHRPLYMNSSEGPDSVTGEIFAVVNSPFATAAEALDKPAHWCDILILHLNTKYCRPSAASRGTILQVAIGKKYDQPVGDAYRVDFAYQVTAKTASYLQVKLNADQGPLSTSNYRIVLEATPAEEGKTFIRLAYSYNYALLGQLAMRAYLGTAGRSKVGFTMIGGESGGQPTAIGGMRGVVERNTMRYYLAIESFLGALSSPPDARLEKSLRDWFTATEAYPRQLHEVEQSEYLAMKRKEYSQQQSQVLN